MIDPLAYVSRLLLARQLTEAGFCKQLFGYACPIGPSSGVGMR